MILLEMDSVTIHRVRQETLIVPHLKEEKLEELLSYQPSYMSLCTEECLLCNLLLLIIRNILMLSGCMWYILQRN
jgi:hypothetical protein